MNQIHDNLSPVNLPLLTIFDWIIVGTMILGIIFLVWKMSHKPKKIYTSHLKKITPKPFILPVFSLEKELRKLKEISEKEDWKTFSIFATQILKKICEQKFKKPFAFATGKEMEEILQEKISTSDLKSIQQFFQILDPIKFAHKTGQKEMTEEIFKILKSLK